MFDEAYMVAIGDDYEKMAELTAPRVEHFLGIKPRVLLQEDCKAGVVNFDAYTAKMSLLEKGRMNGNSVLFLDCDAVIMRGFSEKDFVPGQLNASPCRLKPGQKGYMDIAEAIYPHDVSETVNTGMLAFQRTDSFRRLFRVARRLRSQMQKSSHPYAVGDQLAFNIAMLSMPRHLLKVNRLPQQYNWQTGLKLVEPSDVRVFHFVGGAEGRPGEAADTKGKLERVRVNCERFQL